MFAVIYPASGLPTSHALVPIAGRPLVSRQLQWLRALGVERVALMLPSGPEGDHVARWISDNEPVSRDVVFVRDADSVAEAAARAGFEGRPHLALGSDVVGDGDLSRLYALATRGRVVAHLEPPSGCRAANAFVSVEHTAIEVRHERTILVRGPGWGARVPDLATARELGDRALEGSLPEANDEHAFPIQLHASSFLPGVWVARGATVDQRAIVRAPAWIGPGAVVEAGAKVGPGAHVGARAVISKGASVRDCVVEDGVIVEGGRHREAWLRPGVSQSLDGSHVRPTPTLSKRSESSFLGLAVAATLAFLAFGWWI
jgi:hypothetical protein